MSKKVKKKVNSRAKGADNEVQIAKKLSFWWGEEKSFKRRGFLLLSQARFKGKQEESDLIYPERFPFSIEAKKVEGWSLEQNFTGMGLMDWWDYTLERVDIGKSPMLIFNKNFLPHLCAIPFEVFTRNPFFKKYIDDWIILRKNHNGEKVTLAIFTLSAFINNIPKEDVIKMDMAGWDKRNVSS